MSVVNLFYCHYVQMGFVYEKVMWGAYTIQAWGACPSGGGSCRIIQATSIYHNPLKHNKLSQSTSYNKSYVKYSSCIYTNVLRQLPI